MCHVGYWYMAMLSEKGLLVSFIDLQNVTEYFMMIKIFYHQYFQQHRLLDNKKYFIINVFNNTDYWIIKNILSTMFSATPII